jgi:hypothetical protein
VLSQNVLSVTARADVSQLKVATEESLASELKTTKKLCTPGNP